MTSHVSPDAAGAKAARTAELSSARAFWLLVRLRLARRKNRKRGAFAWALSSAGPSRRSRELRGGSRSRLGFALLLVAIGALCFQSLQFLEGIAREHGALGLQARAALFSSLNVACVLMTGLLGTRA